MKRSKKILIVCHCLLNANAKVYPLARCGGVYRPVLDQYIAGDVGLVQLPCPETAYLGLNRWGMTREQYDHSLFRRSCEELLAPIIDQVKAFARAGYQLVGIIGMDGSPNCGVNRTCHGFSGGEISARGCVEAQRSALTFQPGKGVFMEILSGILAREQLAIPFMAVDEEENVE